LWRGGVWRNLNLLLCIARIWAAFSLHTQQQAALLPHGRRRLRHPSAQSARSSPPSGMLADAQLQPAHIVILYAVSTGLRVADGRRLRRTTREAAISRPLPAIAKLRLLSGAANKNRYHRTSNNQDSPDGLARAATQHIAQQTGVMEAGGWTGRRTGERGQDIIPSPCWRAPQRRENLLRCTTSRLCGGIKR